MTEPDPLEEIAGAILDGTPLDWGEISASMAQQDAQLLRELQILATVKHVASGPPAAAGSLVQWGPLRVLDCVGQGAFGEVYRAWDTRLDREVALKLLPARHSSGDPASTIIEEGRLLARVRHPNVVTIYGAERLDGRTGLWMELVKGRTLEQHVRDGRHFTADEVRQLGVELSGAVSAVHAAGLLHRDIKAHNVMIDDDGRLVLMDFGASWEAISDASTKVTGTPLYLAPEVLSGAPATERSDIYSIGVLLYHLLTGSYPVNARDLAGLRRAHINGDRVDLPPASVPAKLRSIIQRAIHPDPQARFESAKAMAAALSEAREGERLAQQSGRRFAMSVPVWLWSAAVLAGFAVSLAAFGSWTGTQDDGSGGSASGERSAAVLDDSRQPTSSMPLPLTTNAGLEDAPAWSPDGREVAFEWDGEQGDNRDIYIVQPGSGKMRRLTTATGGDVMPAWSPDGSWIAYMHLSEDRKTSTLTLISQDGSRQRTLFTGAARHSRASWFPDSRSLVTEVPPEPGVPGALWAFDIASGLRRPLSSPPSGSIGDQQPAISPDGRSLVFSRKTAWRTAELHLVDLLPDGSVTGAARPLTRLGYAAGPAWTPDGNRILFNAAGEGAGIWQIDRTGGSPSPVFGLPETASQPALTRRPEGHVSLAFRNSVSEYSIRRYDLDRAPSLAPTDLVPSTRNQSYPRYSNDGRRLAFSSTRTGNQEIWLAAAAGSDPVQLTTLGHQLAEVGHWSPNDDAIAFVTQGRGSRELRMVAASGGAPILLTNQPGFDSGSGWSADGHWYYYTVVENGVRNVWRVMRTTRLTERVTSSGGQDGFETDDGTFYYWRRDRPQGATLMQRTPAGDRAVPLIPRGTPDPNPSLRVGTGLYYQAFGTDAIYRFGFDTRVSALLLEFPEPFGPFTVSPDGRWFAANFLKRWTSDLMIIERFVH